MGLVVITMPGEAKRAFVNSLHQKTGEGVDLVIIQKSVPDSFSRRMKRLFSLGVAKIPGELWYGLLLRLMPETRATLEYFRASSLKTTETGYLPKTLIVDYINSDEVHRTLKELSPKVLVMWGSKILKPHIIETAGTAINLHIGRCPKYRGTLANQCAVLRDDRENIGATVHRVAKDVDAGDIFTIIKPDLSKSPRDLFSDLNDRAQAVCIDIASRLLHGEELPSTPQSGIPGENLLLRQWVPSIRYTVAKKMRAWEREHTVAKEA